MPTATAVTLAETSTRLGEQAAGQAARRRVTLIQAGWGSSGYYSRELLERDGPAAFPVGTQMYLDHPSRTEESDRPERSVRDLAARIATTPQMVGDELVAEAEIFPIWQPVIDSIAGDCGLSIRALGETEQGEVDGRSGPIVTALTEGISVDFVTKAGAGGKVGQLIESARLEEARNMGHYLESKIHSMFTEAADNLFGQGHLTRDERIGLSSAIGEALTSFNESIAKNHPQLYQRDPYAEPDHSTTPQVTEAAAGRDKEKHMSTTDDRLAQLEETVRQHQTNLETVTTELEEAKKARDTATTRADRAEEKLELIAADKIVREAVGKVKQLPERAAERAVKEALAEKLPVDDNGKLDKDKLTERATKAAEVERDYLAEAAPSGRVQGFGPSGRVETDGDDEKKLAEAFGRLGMNDDQAKLAAAGR